MLLRIFVLENEDRVLANAQILIASKHLASLIVLQCLTNSIECDKIKRRH